MGEPKERTVHYITYYMEPKSITLLDGSMATLSKIDYVSEALRNIGININLISTAGAKSDVKWMPRLEKEISEKETHISFSSFGSNNKVGRLVSRIWVRTQLLIYLFKNVKSDDTLLIYHSLQYLNWIKLFRFFKSNRFVFQVEEIYSDAYTKFNKYKNKELKILYQGDSFICINENVEEMIAHGRPSTILYGDYRTLKEQNTIIPKSKYVHVVYAGVIETTRNAAYTAAKAARYLNENYIVHIAGFGREEDIQKLKIIINKVNKDLGYKGVQFDGAFNGEELKKYLFEKDIGLSCHSYTEKEMISADVTFPSKVITYLNHGLKVVSPKISCLTKSEVKDFITFYDGFEPEQLAKGIFIAHSKNFEKEHMLIKMNHLDRNFKENIKKIV